MDQEVEIINNNTRIEKMKNFFINYKNQLIILVVVIVLSLFGFFLYEEYKFGNKEKLANKYNNIITKFEINQKENVSSELKEIINVKDKTYSPLAFYFLLDNEMINSNEEINTYFDILINDLDLDHEIKNLIIFKKGLFNSDFAEENELLNM